MHFSTLTPVHLPSFSMYFFSTETITSEMLQSQDTALISYLNDEIANDEQDVRKVTASEALDNLDDVKCFTENHGDKQMNLMLNELIEKVETIKLQNASICFSRNKVVSYHN